MAKNSVFEWSATAANNTEIGTIGITGNDLPRNLDDGFRELMKQIKDFQTYLGITDTGNIWTKNQTISNAGPTLTFTETDTSTDGAILSSGGNLIISADAGATAAGSTIVFRVDGVQQGAVDASGYLIATSGVRFGGTSANDTLSFDDSTNAFSFAADGSVTSGIAYAGAFKTDLSVTSEAFDGNGIAVGLSAGASVFSRSSGTAVTVNRAGSNGACMSFRRGGTESGTITVTAANTTYNTSSDYRLKYDIVDLTGSGEFIDALRPRSGKWVVDDSEFVGFLAHEFAEVTPTSVFGVKDADVEIGTATFQIGDTTYTVVDIPEADAPEGSIWVKTGTRPIYQGMQASTSEVMANIVAELQSLRLRVASLED